MADHTGDPYDLERFVVAQASTYAQALAELRAGRKRSHWIWYVFPQIQGLGMSAASVRYGISGLPEARAYLAHPVLGARLAESVAALSAHRGLGAEEILGSLDAMKLRSCLTLFARAAEPGSPFQAALANYFAGHEDPATIALLGQRQAELSGGR